MFKRSIIVLILLAPLQYSQASHFGYGTGDLVDECLDAKVSSRQSGGSNASPSIIVDFTNTPTLFKFVGDLNTDHKMYLDWVAKSTDLDANGILDHHNMILQDAIDRGVGSDDFRRKLLKSLSYSKMIVGGELGEIRRINCIEAHLFDEQNRRYPLKDFVEEVGALVALSPDKATLRAYVNVNRPDGIPGATIPRIPVQDKDNGWTEMFTFHNHPLSFEGPGKDIGPIAPSNPDVTSNVEREIGFTVITDGRESLQLNLEELEIINSIISNNQVSNSNE